MKFLGIDTETGGLSDYVSLLTVGLVVFDHHLTERDSIEFLVKPEDGEYIVTAEALKINGIDITKHDEIAKTKKEIKTDMFDFLKAHSNDGTDKLIPLGWNVEFDIKRVASDTSPEAILSRKAWLQNVSYRCVDGAGLFMAEKMKGTVPLDARGSLGKVMDYYGLQFPGEAHTALADVRASAMVIKKILEI